MEYKELELLWKQYDEKLDNLEKINKKLLKDTLLRKPQKKLNHLKFGNLYGLIAAPIILPVALHSNFTTENVNWTFILGCLLALGVIVYLCVISLKNRLIFKKIDISTDTTIQSLDKIVTLKNISNNLQKSVWIYYPLAYLGCILISWNSFVFTANTILFLSILFVVTYYVNIWGAKNYKERIQKLEKDIVELKEYTE